MKYFKNLKTEVSTENYRNKIEVLSDDLLKFTRDHDWDPGTSLIDGFGVYWSLALVDGDAFDLNVEKDGEIIPMRGGRGFFFPKFSLVKWKILSPKLSWSGYFSSSPLSNGLFTEPVTFAWDKKTIPNSLTEIDDLLSNAESFQKIGLVAKCDVARKTKLIIDHSYDKNLNFAKVAKEVCTAQEVMNRKFKKSFQISPLDYRNKLRVTDSTVELMATDQSVSNIAFKKGFNDISFFNKVFKREYSATPKKFRTKVEE